MAERVKRVGGAMRREQWTVATADDMWKRVCAAIEAWNRFFADREPFAADLEATARAIVPASQQELRAAEPLSRSWYAVQIIQDIRFARGAIAAGDARLAAQIALRLGAMAREADLRGAWEAAVEKALDTAERQRAGQRDAAAKRAGAIHAEWRREAAKYWAEHPGWSATRVAKKINPARWERIRKVIGPKKSQGVR